MSRQLKRQLARASGGGGAIASSARTPRGRSIAKPRSSPLKRLNRILLIGGGALAFGAVVLAVVERPFNPLGLVINLAAIGLGLLMGKGIGRFMFRHAGNPATLSNLRHAGNPATLSNLSTRGKSRDPVELK